MQRTKRRRLIVGLASAVGVVVLALGCASCIWPKARPIGVVGGRLAPCPDRPNCVESEFDKPPAAIDALAFEGESAAAWARAAEAIGATGGTVQKDMGDYLWATYTSRIFRFVDDLELRLDAENGVIHVRSASRVGYSDYGVNRERVERLRAEFASPAQQ